VISVCSLTFVWYCAEMTDNRTIPKFDHFVITLFNIKNFLDGSNQEIIWLKWTEDRLKLFEEFCLPSVSNQSNRNFKWLLYFDKSSPTYIIEEIKKIITPYDFIRIMYADGYVDFTTQYLIDLKNMASSDWIVQTRFDNDDILHESAIETIQNLINFQHHYFINLSSGYTFEKSTHYLSHYFYSMGPFLTLIENKHEKLKGIYLVNHWQWPGLKLQFFKELLKRIGLLKDNITFYVKKPMWIQFIHEKNMHNSSNRGFPVFFQTDLTKFHKNLVMNVSPLKRLISHIHYVWWKRYFKAFLASYIIKS